MSLTAVAVSGGIDSLAAAWILKKQGHELIGVHFITGYEKMPAYGLENISDQLGIKIKTLDCTLEFKKKVVAYFTRTYLSGRTPNPCLVCNSFIKFGTVLEFSRKIGAVRIGTGHYARISYGRGRYHLLKGIDLKKDQSYFLAFLSREQLASACFPLGEMTKEEVRRLAEENGLQPIVKKESQDICFIHGTYQDFLEEQGVKLEQGNIEDIRGNIIGIHNGLHRFTIGQRRGINCPSAEPWYVVRMDVKRNCLIVGRKNELLSSECRVSGINWINQPDESKISALVRLRYRHNPVPAEISPIDKHTAIVKFQKPQPSVTPGQGAVFYNGEELIAGGWIEGLQ